MDELHHLGTQAEPLSDRALAELYPRRDRPWLRVNFVASLDGAVTVDGYSAGLSGTTDKRVFGLLRMVCDAVLVGAGTLRHEGYGPIRLDEPRRAWRRERGLPEYPTMVVVSGRLDLDPDSPVFAEAPTTPVVVTHRAAPAGRRAALDPVADVLAYGEHVVDLPAALTALHDRGLGQVLCEGGPHLLGSLTDADLVDELCLTVAPLLVGPGAGRITAGQPLSGTLRRLGLRHALRGADLLLLRYARPE